MKWIRLRSSTRLHKRSHISCRRVRETDIREKDTKSSLALAAWRYAVHNIVYCDSAGPRACPSDLAFRMRSQTK
eukprot:scaffold7730_cov630-Pinguiococcus_pyrenoidosus.AAC.1